MSVDFSGFTEMRKRIEALTDDMPKIMEQLVVGEGVYAVGQARRICKEDGIVNNGTYRMNFHAGDKALSLGANEKAYDGGKIRRSGQMYSIDVYNNLDYAKHLEYGFRSHFVPGYWAGHTFVYQPGYPGGMYVGPYNGFVNGHFMTVHPVLCGMPPIMWMISAGGSRKRHSRLRASAISGSASRDTSALLVPLSAFRSW